MGESAIRQINSVINILITFFLLFCIVNQIITTNVVAEEVEEPEDNSSSRLRIVGRLLKFFGKLYSTLVPVIQMFLVAVAADPAYIEIGYEETVSVDIGMINLKTGEFSIFDKEPGTTIFNDRFLNFEVAEFPGGNVDGSWHVEFHPETVLVNRGQILKTEALISITSPPVSKNAIQSGILKIRIIDTWAFGNLWTPPKNSPINRFPYRLSWFINAAFLMGYGRMSGTVDTTYKDLEILVKVKPYHEAKLEALSLVEMRPNEITSIPISIQNMGNYNDTFSFRVVSENKNIIISEPVSITMAPGETKDTYIGVSALPSIFDYGTLNEINIEAFSINDANTTIASRKVLVETKGVFVPETIGIIFFSLIAFLIFSIAYSSRKKKDISKRPQKKIKKVKKKAKKGEKVKSSFFNLFKESDKDKKEKIKLKEEKIPVIKEEIIGKKAVKKPVIDKKVIEEQNRKEKAIQKIKYEQEKQKRKVERRMK